MPTPAARPDEAPHPPQGEPPTEAPQGDSQTDAAPHAPQGEPPTEAPQGDLRTDEAPHVPQGGLPEPQTTQDNLHPDEAPHAPRGEPPTEAPQGDLHTDEAAHAPQGELSADPEPQASQDALRDRGAPSPAAGARAARPRSLRPPEHGAYPQLAFVLLSALIWRPPTLAGLALAAAAVLAFFLQEPLRVRLGARGARRQAEDGARAQALALRLGLGLLLTAGLGIALAGPGCGPPLAVAGGMASLLGLLAYLRLDHNLPGELLAGAGFAAAGLPVAAACGVPTPRIAAASAIWWASFALATLAVHAILSKKRRRRHLPAGPVWAALATALAVALTGPPLGAPASLALLPAVIIPAALLWRPPASTKTLGLWLTTSQALSLIALRTFG